MGKRKQKSYSWAYRARHLQRGLCGFCPRKAVPGHTMCTWHRALESKRQRRYKAAWIAQGKCRTCGHEMCESDRGRIVCRECSAKTRHQTSMRL
jgi:hypothetical protein